MISLLKVYLGIVVYLYLVLGVGKLRPVTNYRASF